MADGALKLLASTAKIERDRGVLELRRFLNTVGNEEVAGLEDLFLQILGDSTAPWESVQGALMGVAALITHNAVSISEQFVANVQERAIKLLEHKESRIRLSAGNFQVVIFCIISQHDKLILIGNVYFVVFFF